MLELYSSWCGHCQHFAPAMKKLGEDVKQWRSVIRIGVLECAASKENQDICAKFNVGGYPSIRVWSNKSFLHLFEKVFTFFCSFLSPMTQIP